jgi:putative flippase GtrA
LNRGRHTPLWRLHSMKGGGLLFLRFLAVGGLNTAFGYACYAGLVLLGAPLWLAVGGATLLAFFFNFFSYGGLVFGRTSYLLLPRFLIFYSGMSVTNFALLRVLTGLGFGPLLAQALLLPLLAASGFIVMRRFVFGGRHRGAEAREIDEAANLHREI